MTVAAAADFRVSSLPAAMPSVLIVEDQLQVRWQLIDHFCELGIVPLSASCGFEAIRIAGTDRPDVILLDGLVPDMHGFEIARFIRNIDCTYRPYIVLMTAIYKHVRYRNEAKLKYRIDDYLIKPVERHALASIVAQAKEVLQ